MKNFLHLLPKTLQHTVYLSYIAPRPGRTRRPVAQIETYKDGTFLATVDAVSPDLVVLNTDIEHPDARPKARRCVRIRDIKSIAVKPIPSKENTP